MHRIGDVDKGGRGAIPARDMVFHVGPAETMRPLVTAIRKGSIRFTQWLHDNEPGLFSPPKFGGIHIRNTDTMMEILDMAKKHEDEKRKGRTDPVIVQGHEVLTTPGPVVSPSNMMEGPMAEPEKPWTTRGRPGLKRR